MANTSFCGTHGAVHWNSGTDEALGNVVSWSVETQAETAEATCMGEGNGWKQYRAGFREWTARVQMRLSSTGPNLPLAEVGREDDGQAEPTPCRLELWFTDSKAGGYLAGPAVCTEVQADADTGKTASFTAVFRGNGALTFATS